MSDVTSILTGRLNLKRNTSYLLDQSAIAASLSATRQPGQQIRLQVEIVGNTVSANGRVTVFDNTGAGVSQYVVQDRTLSTKWAIKISGGSINVSSTVSSASSEPIVQDSLTSGQYWKIFVDDGVFGIEGVATVQNDEVLLIDTIDATTYKLIVSDGIPGISINASVSEVFTFSENSVKFGSRNFYVIDGITTSGITDGFIKIRAVSKLGQPVNQLLTISSNVPCRFFTQKGRIRMKKPGQDLIADYKIMLEPEFDIRENDLIFPLNDVVGLTLGEIIFVEKIWDFDGLTHHTEAGLIDL